MELEDKIDDISMTIDDLDNVIYRLMKYEKYKDVCSDLKAEKSILEFDLDELKQVHEELIEAKTKELKMENKEQERQYWREAI